jgi:hypothetical protein
MSVAYLEANQKQKNSLEGSPCTICTKGFLTTYTHPIVYEFTNAGIEPIFNKEYLRCNHCFYTPQSQTGF